MNLGELEYLVMLSVMQLAPEQRFGQHIHEELVRRSKRKANYQTVYSTLNRLEDKSLLRSKKTPGPVEGRSRRLFGLTATGDRAVRTYYKTRCRMEEGLGLA